jgi:hypothetical protein
MVVTKVGGLKEMCPDEKVGYVVEPNTHNRSHKGLNQFLCTEADLVTHMTKNIIEEKKEIQLE